MLILARAGTRMFNCKAVRQGFLARCFDIRERQAWSTVSFLPLPIFLFLTGSVGFFFA